MKKIFILLAIIATITLNSCTDAVWEKSTNYGNSFTVEMYSGGVLVRSWTSSGKVQSEDGSDGYYFKDSKTGKLVEVAGDIVITNINIPAQDLSYPLNMVQ